MTEHVYTTLREANRVRQAEWDKDAQISLSYRGNELAGETGEACNIIKKLERERLGIRGSRTTRDKLAEELADVVICADLIAMAENIDLDAAVAAKFNATSEKVGLATRYDPDAVSPDFKGAVMMLRDLAERLAAGQNPQAVPEYAFHCREAIDLLVGQAINRAEFEGWMVDRYLEKGRGIDRATAEAFAKLPFEPNGMHALTFGDPEHDWTKSAAHDLADEDMSCWEAA